MSGVVRSKGMRPTGTAQELEARRKVAARLFSRGKTNADVAETCGVSLSAVKIWKRRWKEAGVAGLAAKPHPGPTPHLSQRDLAKLEKLLLAGAQRAGFDSDLWTCSRIARLIQDRFDVEYHPSHVWKILRRLGWSCQKPECRARERDEAAVEAWRKRDWPRIKKGASA